MSSGEQNNSGKVGNNKRERQNFTEGKVELRRSKRLMTAKGKALEAEVPAPTSALGIFAILPVEVRFLILNQLSVKDLGIVVLCSKEMRDLVLEYFASSRNWPRLLPHFGHGDVTLTKTERLNVAQEYRILGVFLKRSTCLYPTKERMRRLTRFVSMFFGGGKATSVKADSNQVSCLCQAMIHYGTLIHTFIAGWEESECFYVHYVLEQVSTMNKAVPNVLSSPFGSEPEMEMYIRRYYNYVYIRSSRGATEQAFWISRLLKQRPIVHQAKLMYIIFGPTTIEEKINWNAVCDETLLHEEQAYLVDLASCFHLLQKCAEWTQDDLVSIFEDLIATPVPWLTENVASLLLLLTRSGPLAKLYLENKMINGKTNEVGEILCHAVLVCARHDKCSRIVANLFQKLYFNWNNREKRSQLYRAVLHSSLLLSRKLTQDEVADYDDFSSYVNHFSHFADAIHETCFSGAVPPPAPQSAKEE